MLGEKQNIFDVRLIEKEHEEAVDAEGDAGAGLGYL